MNRLVLANATLLDGEHAPQSGATVVVDGERISEVAVGHPVKQRPDDRVVDLGGRTVMPGMATCHFHSTYHEIGSVPAPFGLEEPPALMAMWAAHHFRLAIESGFTMAISAGAAHGIDASMKMAVEQGLIVGPRILAGSRDISSTGHSNDFTFPTYWDVRAMGSIHRADGPDEFRKAVRYEIKDGAEIIKLFVTGGHGVPGPKESVELTDGELAAAIEAAHLRNAKIRGHIANRDVLMLAIELGIDLVDHADGMDTEAIERLVEAGIFVVPSVLFPYQLCEKHPAAAEALSGDIEAMLKILPEANDAGVKLLLGDDWGAMGFAHGRYAEEVEFYVREAGIDPVDVIRWATKHGAEMLGMGSDLGTVTEGKLADLLVVDGDVCADVKILQDKARFLAILKGGEAVVDTLDSLVPSVN